MPNFGPPIVPVSHGDEQEHRRLLATRANASIAPALVDLQTGQMLFWDGAGWANSDLIAVTQTSIRVTLPTSSAGLSSGELWQDAGSVRIVP